MSQEAVNVQKKKKKVKKKKVKAETVDEDDIPDIDAEQSATDAEDAARQAAI